MSNNFHQGNVDIIYQGSPGSVWTPEEVAFIAKIWDVCSIRFHFICILQPFSDNYIEAFYLGAIKTIILIALFATRVRTDPRCPDKG